MTPPLPNPMNSKLSGRQSRRVGFLERLKKPLTPAKNLIKFPLSSTPCLLTKPTTVSWLLFINTGVEAQRPYRKPYLFSNTHASGWSFRSIRHINCTKNWLQNIFALVASMTPKVKHHIRIQCNCHSKKLDCFRPTSQASGSRHHTTKWQSQGLPYIAQGQSTTDVT